MAEKVLVYDTTLRDGMQGEGMSLSVEREGARGARARRARRAPDRGGLPGLEPQGGGALRAARAARRFEHGRGRRLRHDPPPRLPRPTTIRRCALLADSFAPVCTLVGKTWSLHLEKVTQVDPEENLRDDRRLGRLPASARASASSTTPSTSSTRYRDDPAYALRCLRAAAEAGAENVTLCDTNGSSLPEPGGGGHRARWSPSWATACRSASTPTTTPAAAWPTRSWPSSTGARLVQGTMNGYGERCGNANLVTILPALELKLGYECVGAERLRALTETAHLVDELCNVTPNPNQPYVGANAFAHKGGMHVAGVNRDARTFEHLDPAEVGADRARAGLRAVRQGHRAGARRSVDDATAAPRGRAREGARAPRLPVRGRRRLVRPADPQGDGRLRAAVPARVLARDRREARGRQRRDRGHDQDLGRRRALRAHRRGQRPGARARQGAARRDRRALPAPARHRAGELQGAHPGRDARAPARSRACCSTPATAATPGARSACPRTSSRPAGRRSSTRSRRACCPAARDARPPRGRASAA